MFSELFVIYQFQELRIKQINFQNSQCYIVTVDVDLNCSFKKK